MTYAQRLRKLANSTGLDAFGDEIRAIADEMDEQPAEVTLDEVMQAAKEATAPEWQDVVDGWHMGLDLMAFARAILALRPVQVPMTDEQPVSNPDELPKGFVPLQRENGKLVYAACLDGGRYHGWLMWKHPDGQWVTKRKMTSLEVMQAEDQDHYGIVQDAHHGITDKGGA